MSHAVIPVTMHQENEESVPQATGTGTLVARGDKQNRDTIPMPTFAGRPSTMSSLTPVEFPQNSDSKYLNCNSTNSLIHNHFWFGKYDSLSSCSDFPSEAMLWIKEVEKVDSFDELKSSRSVCGKNFPNFEMLDAKIASPLNKIIQNSHVEKEGQPRGAESPKRGPVSTRKTDRLHDLRLLSSDWRS